MNIHDHRKLGEALRAWEQEWSTYFEEIFYNAARQTYDRYQECGECEDGQINSGRPPANLPEFQDKYPCPSCGGSGLQPNQARLKAVLGS